MVLKNQKLYVLSITLSKSELVSKIGETHIDMKKRITAFGIGGQWKGREDEIKIELEIDTLLAPTIERMVKKTLQKNWKDKQLKDKNLGRGYTEWYRMKPNSMIAIVRKTFDTLYRKDKILRRKLRGKK